MTATARRTPLAAALLLGLLAPLVSTPPATADPGPASPPSPGAAATPRPLPAGSVHPLVTRLIVTTEDRSTASTSLRTAAASLAGVASTGVVRRTAGGATVLRLSEPVTVDEATAASRALMARGDVAYAEPDLPMFATAAGPVTPDDPLFSRQWDLWDSASALPGGYSARASAAWATTTGSSSVVVAVVDTGVTDHAQLAGSLVPGYDFVSDPVFANDGDGRDGDYHDPGDWTPPAEAGNPASTFYGCPTTSSWHGTHVSGTIAAHQGDAAGTTGMAPGVLVEPVRALGRCFGFTSDIADAITWAAGNPVVGAPANAHPATVINLSLGGDGTCAAGGVIQTAIDGARARGATVVAAAGNQGQGITVGSSTPGSVPANCAGVVRVVATGRDGRLASYSNTGTTTQPATLAAPGGSGSDGILSTVDTGATSPVGDGYATYQGTSMAAPHVSAAAALVQSLTSPRMTPDQVAARLSSTARAFPAGSGCGPATCGPGILDAAAALPTAPAAPTEVEAAGGDAALDVVWEPAASPSVPVLGYHVAVSSDGGASWADAVASTGSAATSLRITSYGAGVPVTNGAVYLVRVSGRNAVGEGPSTVSNPALPGAVHVPGRPGSPTLVGGIERFAVTWSAPPDGGSPIRGYTVRYRRTGTAAWQCAAACAPVAGSSVTVAPWPAPLPGGSYEVQVAARNDLGQGLHGPAALVAVTGLRQTATLSSPVLRPFRDHYLDAVRITVASNVRSSGVVRILDPRGRPVRLLPLAAGTAWSVVWDGTDARRRTVAYGVYRAEVRLVGRSSVATAVARPAISVASSRASVPTVRLSTGTVYPVRDGYLDSVRITSSAGVPAAMTWTVLAGRRVVWTATFPRRGVATATWTGRDRRGRVLATGRYLLRVTAVGGEGRARVTTTRISVSGRRTASAPFTTRVTAAGTAAYGFGTGTLPSVVEGAVELPAASLVTFGLELPRSITVPTSLTLTTCSQTVSGTPRPQTGWYSGRPDSPTPTKRIALTAGCVRLAVPSSAVVGGNLRWWAGNTATTASRWRITSYLVTGVARVLV